MIQYKQLDKELKNIRKNLKYDLYEVNLESQKKIDQFYMEEIAENDLMRRKYQLESYINRKNILFFPIIITIIFGLLVNLTFNEIDQISEFIKTIQKSQTNLIVAITSIILGILLVPFLTFIFYTPFPSLNFLFELGQNKTYQSEYELKILNEKIDKKLKENKNGKEYIKKPKRKIILKPYIFTIIMILLGIIVGITWNISLYKVFILIFIGIICAYFILQVDGKK